MEIFLKSDISGISDTANTVINEIDSFSSNLQSILEEFNSEFEERFDNLLSKKDDIVQKINSNELFSDKVKARLEKQLQFIYDEVEDENLGLSIDISEDDIVNNYSDDPESFLNKQFFLDEHRDFIESKIYEIEERINNIKRFTSFTRKKIKLVIERREGIIAIKNKNHPDYLKNKSLDININNPEVIFAETGLFSQENGWSIPDSMIADFKILKSKINALI
jgi:hypothetical protein